MEDAKKTPKFEIESEFRVCNNETGSQICVLDDRDGLGLVELISKDGYGTESGNITMTKEEARLLITAMVRYLALLDSIEEEKRTPDKKIEHDCC